MPVTFAVDPVKPNSKEDAKSTLPSFHYDYVMNRGGTKHFKLPMSSSVQVDQVHHSSFVRSVLQAYSDHHSLELRPDNVWLAIMIQFSKHVELHGEELRSRFVDHEGQKQISILCTSIRNMISDLAPLLQSHLKQELQSWIIPNFSTTTDQDRVVGAAILLTTLQTYFSISASVICGIPSITLLGERSDWEELQNRAERLIDFDDSNGLMSQWVTMLRPILSQFTQCFTDKGPDVAWWQKMVLYRSGGCGPSYMDGWITAFSVFRSEGKKVIWQGDNRDLEHKRDPSMGNWPSLSGNEWDSGICSMPLTITRESGDKVSARLFVGHMSCSLEKNVDSHHSKWKVVPRLDWFVAEEKDEREMRTRGKGERTLPQEDNKDDPIRDLHDRRGQEREGSSFCTVWSEWCCRLMSWFWKRDSLLNQDLERSDSL